MKLDHSVLALQSLLLLALASPAKAAPASNLPDTPKRPVTDEYQGLKVTDDYRWLENWNDPEVKRWSAAENARSREYLDHLPSRPAVRASLARLVTAVSANHFRLQFRAGKLFAMRYQPPQQQPAIVVLSSADDPAGATIVFDPNAASSKGSVAVDFFVPSPTGKYIAAALSQNGSEDSSARVFEVATGKELADAVPRVNFATVGGSIAWKRDESGFYYTRYPQGNERPPEDVNFYQQVYFPKLGADPRQDTYVIGREFPRIAEIKLQTSDDGRWLLASVANGDGGQFAHYLMDSLGRWIQLTRFEDGIVLAKFGPGNRPGEEALYLLSRKNAPRGQILSLPLTHLDLSQAKIVVHQSSGLGSDEASRASIEDFVAAPAGLYVIDIMGGPSRVRVFDPKGEELPAPPLPPISSVGQVISLGDGSMLFHTSTYIDPPAWYRYDAASGKVSRTALLNTSPLRFDDSEVVREFATSKDGTRVPLNIIRRKGTHLDGNNPVLLGGYGGFDVSSQPHFLGYHARLWLDQGGILAEANLRGGGEYGEEWHKAGNLIHKQNVFDDFLACAQYLVDRKYTSPAHLAILGGSNGGLLMGAAFTQRPDLFRVVVSEGRHL